MIIVIEMNLEWGKFPPLFFMINMEKNKLNKHQLKQIYIIECTSYNHEEAYSFQFIEKLNEEKNVNIFIEHQGNQIIGFLIYEFDNIKTHVIDIAVMEEYRRCNVGYGLLKKLDSLIQRYGVKCYAEVRKSNIASIKCFKKAGYKMVGEISNYYDNPVESAMVLEK